MSERRFNLRVARPADADAVSAVLARSYPALMAADYGAAVLAVVLPAIIVANPGLLASGRYHVQALADGRIVSCGGWTHEEPGSGKVESGVAHIRHFGTDADWIRHGLGRGIFERCQQQAMDEGAHTLMCFSSLGAEVFYSALGFRTIGRNELSVGGQSMTTVTMVK